MPPFDLTESPIDGTNLIEAGAGTGKTYVVTGLFLRLILEKMIPAEEILVVTYTLSATAELKDRIRSKLRQVRQAFQTGNDEGNSFIRFFLDRITDKARAIDAVTDALTGFDRTPIFTIHGFCRRILLENAFETGYLFDTDLVADPAVLWKEVADDYWRIRIYNLQPEVVRYVVQHLKGPEYFFDVLKTVVVPDIRVIPDITQPQMEHLEAFRNAYQRLRERWRVGRDTVVRILNTASLDGRIYGTVAPHPEDSRRTRREIKILSMVEAMERFLNRKSTGFPLFKGFEYITAGKLADATTGGNSAPRHEIFDLCEALATLSSCLEKDMATYLMFLKKDFFEFAVDELEKRKHRKNIQFFEDLLTRVRQALLDDRGGRLVDAIHQKYKAALIDEFQDTDFVQYDIFIRLFGSEDRTLFLIGDPKQAIYGFRGADIFSYLKASRQVKRKYTLVENYRSHPDLIRAVNTLFTQRPCPFLFDDIRFEPGLPALESLSETGLDSPFVLWYLIPENISDSNRPLNKGEAIERIAKSTAAEISRIISKTPLGISAQAAPNQIAVLVRTNRQARIVRAHLSKLRIPSVLYSSEDIFNTHEATEMVTVLNGISDPANDRRVRAALVTDMIGTKGEALDSETPESTTWNDRLSRFRHYHRIWKNQGFMRMFRILLKQENIRERLVALPDGERRLTNILHLSEILHHAAEKNHSGMTGLVKWLVSQNASRILRDEEHQLRLESDELAVKIVTIHKSKGLEYDIIFCPFAWEGTMAQKNGVMFHDPVQDYRMTLDLAGSEDGEARRRQQYEQSAEYLRLLYVALTRAKKKCYLVCGRIHTAELSPLAYLLLGEHSGDRTVAAQDPVDAIKKAFLELDSEIFLSLVNKLAFRSEGVITVCPIPLDNGMESEFCCDPVSALSLRTLSKPLPDPWSISSYSSLTSRSESFPEKDISDHDAIFPPRGAPPVDLSSDISEPNSVLAFPKGIKAGLFFHDLIEHYDFNDEFSDSLVTQRLQEFGFDVTWRETVCRVLQNLSRLRLNGVENEFSLSCLRKEQRRHEIEFYYPIKPVDPRALKTVFMKHGGCHIPERFPERLDALTFRPAAGFMKGFIDMVFEHKDRFYLVDWKSNHLGHTVEDYEQNALNHVMATDFYVLQYHLYVLALHQYLRFRLPGYTYESHFGGVYYIFLRGIERKKDPDSDRGVYHDVPDRAIIHALGETLIPGFSE